MKTKIHGNVALPVIYWRFETQTLTMREEYWLRLLENKMERKIYGLNSDEVTIN